jgi:hypothetical protein
MAAKYELYSAPQADPDDSGHDVFRPKRRVLEDGEIVAAFEREMRNFIRRDGSVVRQADGEVSQASEPASDMLRVQLQLASNDAVECIDRVILDLQELRNTLRREGERLERAVNSYLDLSHAAKKTAREIAENLAKWKMVPGNLDRTAAE